MSRIDAHSFSLNWIGNAVRILFPFLLISPIAILAWSVRPESWVKFCDSWQVFDWIACQRFFSSMVLAIWTVSFSVLIAIPVYSVYLNSSTNWRQGVIFLSLLPLSYPPFGVASGWMTLISWLEQSNTGRLLFERRGWASQWLYTQGGGGWLLALCFWPIVFLLLALSSEPRRSQVEAARLCLSRRAMIRHVLWPAWREPLFIAASVIACLCLLQFETPSLLQLQSYPLEIFTRFSIPENEWKAVILCIPYAGIALLFAWSLLRAGRCFGTIANDPPISLALPVFIHVFRAFTLFVFLFSCLIPLLSLLLYSGSFSFTLQTMLGHSERLVRSLLYAGGGAGVILLLGVTYTAAPTSRRTIIAPMIFIALFACPGILIASGWLQLRSFWPGAIPSVVEIVSLLGAHTTHRMILGYAAGVLLWRIYGVKQREFECLLRLGIINRLRFLIFPTLFRPASFGIMLASLLLWGDIAITILLHPPGGDTLAVEYYNLLHYGNEARTAAIGFLLLLTPTLILMIAYSIIALGRKLRPIHE